jgi:hypothetical protein
VQRTQLLTAWLGRKRFEARLLANELGRVLGGEPASSTGATPARPARKPVTDDEKVREFVKPKHPGSLRDLRRFAAKPSTITTEQETATE